jgi:hypothetical protein
VEDAHGGVFRLASSADRGCLLGMTMAKNPFAVPLPAEFDEDGGPAIVLVFYS